VMQRGTWVETILLIVLVLENRLAIHLMLL
jgi:hypothetical protein